MCCHETCLTSNSKEISLVLNDPKNNAKEVEGNKAIMSYQNDDRWQCNKYSDVMLVRNCIHMLQVGMENGTGTLESSLAVLKMIKQLPRTQQFCS